MKDAIDGFHWFDDLYTPFGVMNLNFQFGRFNHPQIIIGQQSNLHLHLKLTWTWGDIHEEKNEILNVDSV